jgi:hypothetical protein
MNEEKLIQKNVTVELDDKTTYIFRIPNLRDWIRIRARVRSLVRQDDPASDGNLKGYDDGTALAYTGVAMFEILYEGGDNTWVLSPGPDAKPCVNPEKWPPNAPFIDVISKLNEKLEEFVASPTSSPE